MVSNLKRVPDSVVMSAMQKWRHRLADVREDVLGLIYPRLCDGCDEPLRELRTDLRLCVACEQGLERIQEPFCSICCQPFDGVMNQGFECVNCGTRHLEFDFAVCAYRSRGLAREMVHQFKYERKYHLVRPLRELVIRAIEDPRIDPSEKWLVVPVPLHPRRRREREFNQSEEIGRGLTRHFGWPMVHALQRVRYTRRQAKLDRRERLKNLREAFGPVASARTQEKISGHPVLLVDDVLTTGATASTCASILRALGAAKVVVVTPVRG